MIDDGDIATALIAKLASNDLGMVDQFTEKRQTSGMANRLDPMSFVQRQSQAIPRAPQENPVSIEKQRAILEEANRMAEQLHPLPPPPVFHSEAPVQREPQLLNSDAVKDVVKKMDDICGSLSVINNTLEKLVDALKYVNK